MGNNLISARPRSYGFFEDFLDFVSGDLFTDTSGDSGAAVANVDAAGGQVTLTTGATDNNECYLLTTKELFLFAANKPARGRWRFKHTEANTDDANIAFGFMNAVGADSILDNGGGPKASYSGAVVFKVDGGTKWNAEVSIAGTQSTVELSAATTLTKADVALSGGGFKGGAGHADGLGGDADAAGFEVGEGDLVAFAFLAEQGGGRHAPTFHAAWCAR